MALRYSILPAPRLILVQFSGRVSAEEFRASATVICADGRYGRGFDGLIDLSAVGALISAHDVAELAHLTSSKRKHGRGKWAVIVTTPMATALMMLFQQGVSSRHPFAVFSTFEGASEFLGTTVDAEFLNAVLPLPAVPEPGTER